MKRSQQHLNASQAFSEIAADYDRAYGPEGNAVMTWMRRESLDLLGAIFPPGSRLLELGCGTGEEAVALARAGREVLATDVSTQMVTIARDKAVAAGVIARVHVAVLAAGDIEALRPARPYDGAYASFGGLNCEPDIPAVGAALARLVRPGGAFVTSVMGRTCLFEIMWYLAHLQPQSAFRRICGGWQFAPVAGKYARQVVVPTRYLTTREITLALSAFTLERVVALPLLLPPPYADALYRRHPAFFRQLERYDRSLRERPLWRQLGDHTVLVLRRR